MSKLTIDHREVEVPQGATVLAAAHRLGIDIPALCHREGCGAATSCLACLVRIDGSDRLVPSCATKATEGMWVESETDEVHTARRTALELLLSDHLGDCVAPCQFGCPALMDIPKMLRQIASGEMREAIATVKRDIALPAVLGRICPAPCEKVCRRGDLDSPVSICLLKRLVADVDLASGDPYVPACQPESGKRVVIVGAGPTGLAAAYYLRQRGHACAMFEERATAGGRLLDETANAALSRDVLEAEIATILHLGIDLQTGQRIADSTHAELRSRYDAVLLACGATGGEQAPAWNLAVGPRGITVEPRTYQTDLPGVFAAGSAIRGKTLVVRSVADGKEAAISIDQFLRGVPVTGPEVLFSTKIGRMQKGELATFAEATLSATGSASAGYDSALVEPVALGGLTLSERIQQARRCLHCDCRGAATCKLRKYGAMYGAHPRRFKAERRAFIHETRHAEVVYEPGKCIACGLCIQIAEAAGEPLGLTFVGRGFDVRVAVPMDRPMGEALTKAAAQCVAACPTAALAWKAE